MANIINFGTRSSDSTVQQYGDELNLHVHNFSNPHKVRAEQIGAVPTTTRINGKMLTSNISLNADDVQAAPIQGSFYQPTTISWNTDFDNLTDLTYGARYLVSSDSIAASCNDCPIPKAGYLELFAAQPKNNLDIIQLYITYDDVIYKRYFGWNSGWSVWRSVDSVVKSGTVSTDHNGTASYELYSDGKVHEWGGFNMNIAYTVKYGETMWFHSDTNDTSVDLPIALDKVKLYSANASFTSTGIVWCGNTVVLASGDGSNQTSTLYIRTISGSKQSSLSVGINWDVWGWQAT